MSNLPNNLKIDSLQIKRGAFAKIPALAEGELYYAKDENKLYIGTANGNVELSPKLIKTTYADLKDLRDNSELIPGAFYQITDYETTTTQPETAAAGHHFDIIVQALAPDKLSENATATRTEREVVMKIKASISSGPADPGTELLCRGLIGSQIMDEGYENFRFLWTSSDLEDGWVAAGLFTEKRYPEVGDIVYNHGASEAGVVTEVIEDIDEYFASSKLETWKLKYSLDNDKSLFYWADEVNGKGVIYRMIDDWNNDLPYDFKNILFKRYKITEYEEAPEFEGKYYALKSSYNTIPGSALIDEEDYKMCYTFTVIDENDAVNDASLNVNKTFISDVEYTYFTRDNKIASYVDVYYDDLDQALYLFMLGNNVFYFSYLESGYWEFYGFHSNTIGNNFYSNTIGNGFKNNTIGNDFYYNTIGNNFYSNTIGNGFKNNTIGNYFTGNTIGNDFSSNTIGNDFSSNTIGNGFISNTIGDSFYNNTIGNNFYYNTIGNYFNDNTCLNRIKLVDMSSLAELYNKNYAHTIYGIDDGVIGWTYFDPTTHEFVTDTNAE